MGGFPCVDTDVRGLLPVSDVSNSPLPRGVGGVSFDPPIPPKAMSRVCAITGKRPTKGRRIIHKGQSKKSGGIGLQLVKQTKRTFKPNLQRIRVKLPSGQVKRLWVSVKAIKAGLVTKA